MEKLMQKHKVELAKFKEQKETIHRLWNIEQETAQFLYFSVRGKQPETILELGTSNGYSTFWLSLAAEQSNGTVTTIEIDEYRFQLARKNLQNRTNINFILGMAEEIIPALDTNFDFIFIDACKINYLDYLKLILPRLNDFAIVIADNVISHYGTVKDYLDFVRYHSNFVSMELKIGDGLEISIYQKDKEHLCQTL